MASPLSDKGTQTVSKIPQPKNWRVRIAEARKRGSFTMQDMLVSGEWFSCACGNLDKRIPRYDTGNASWYRKGTPVDRRLRELGSSFPNAVGENDFDGALDLLDAIEAREAELLADLAARDAGVHAQTPQSTPGA